MTLTHVAEVLTPQKEYQQLLITAEVNSLDEASELTYDAFKALLYIDNAFVADISPLLAKTSLFTSLVDSIDWAEKYAEQCS